MKIELSKIAPAELAAAMDSTHLSLIDIRHNWKWSTEKIRGALHEDPGQVEQWAANYPNANRIVLYCASPKETTSRRVAEKLISIGFQKVEILSGGWHVWKSGRFPTERKLPYPRPGGLVTGVLRT